MVLRIKLMINELTLTAESFLILAMESVLGCSGVVAGSKAK